MIISIYGGSGAGKSILAIKLAKFLGDDKAIRIPTDYFLKPKGQKSLVTYLSRPLEYDWDLLNKTIKKEAGSLISIPNFDFIQFIRKPGAFKIVKLKEIKILDGMLPCPGSDLLLYLNLSEKERKKRIEKRDNVWKTRVIERWQNLEKTRKQSESLLLKHDLVLSGSEKPKSNVKEIMKLLEPI